jgi:isoleucyl-tRNA synthetase
VEGVSGVRRDVVDSVRDIILDEVNVRNIEFIRDAGTVVSRTAKANFKSLGPRLGKQMKEAAARIAALDAVEISQFLEAGSLDLVIGETALTLGPEDMEIVSEELGGWCALETACFGGLAPPVPVTSTRTAIRSSTRAPTCSGPISAAIRA